MSSENVLVAKVLPSRIGCERQSRAERDRPWDSSAGCFSTCLPLDSNNSHLRHHFVMRFRRSRLTYACAETHILLELATRVEHTCLALMHAIREATVENRQACVRCPAVGLTARSIVSRLVRNVLWSALPMRVSIRAGPVASDLQRLFRLFRFLLAESHPDPVQVICIVSAQGGLQRLVAEKQRPAPIPYTRQSLVQVPFHIPYLCTPSSNAFSFPSFSGLPVRRLAATEPGGKGTQRAQGHGEHIDLEDRITID